MSDDLLTKEKEYRRINKELAIKTKNLFEDIDVVINSRTQNVSTSIDIKAFQPRSSTAFNSFHAESPIDIDFDLNSFMKNHNTGLNIGGEIQPKSCSRAATPTEIDNEIALMNDENLLQNGNSKRNDAIIRFLKAKLKMVLSELDTIKDQYKKKCSYLRDLESENQKSKDSKDRLYNQIKALKDTITKLQGNISNHQSELQTRTLENNSLKKEIDSLKKEMKNFEQQSNNLDVRLNKSLEDNEKLKNTIKFNKIEERDLRDQVRRLQENERQIIKKVEKQRNEVLQAFKKQIILIDNLKKQKAYLQADKQIQLTRKEFMKLLE